MDRPNKNADTVGVLMYLAAALLFAFNASISKLAMAAGLDPVHLTEIRNAGAMVVLVVFVLLTNRSAFRVRRSEWVFLIAYGVIAFAIVLYLYLFTISRLPLGVGTLLAFLAPVVVALWVRFRQQGPVPNRLWIAIALTLVGLALVSQIWNGLQLDTLGVIAGLVLALALATYWLLGETVQQHRDGVSLSMWGFIFSSVVWGVVAPWWNFPWEVLGRVTQSPFGGFPALPVWAIVLWGVLLGTVAPFLLVLGSLRRIGAGRAGIVATTEPLWAGLIAIFVLGETLTWVQALGGLVVVVGIVTAESSRRTAVNDPEDFLPIPL